MLSINISETIWTVINFFLLLFVLKKFLFDPVSRFMDERQARIDAGLEAERQARESLAENARSMAAQKADARREAAALLNETETEDAKRTAEAYVRARENADAIRKKGEEKLQKRSEREAEELAAKTPELAVVLAAHLLHEEE